MTSTVIGELLKRYRKDAGLTQEGLGARAAISARTVSDIECGMQRQPRAATLHLLAAALDLRSHDRRELLAAVDPHLGRASRQSDQLIGRAAEIASVVDELKRHRFVTVTGPAGVGKSAVARCAAAALEPSCERVVLIDLASSACGAEAETALWRALAAKREANGTLADALDKVPTAIVLDNFDHLASAAPCVARIVARTRRTLVLVTSRTRLRVAGEHAIALAPLRQRDAVALFRRCAHASSAGSAASGERDDVAEICERLDRLPLAIELAAPRARILSLKSLRARLDDGLGLLAGGRVDAHERQRTMRSAIAWSYDMLDAPAQDLFKRLALVEPPFTLAIAETVGAHGARTLALLDALVEASLLNRVAARDGEGLLTMLRTIRDFAAEELAEDALAHDDARRRLATIGRRRWTAPIEGVERAGTWAAVAETIAACAALEYPNEASLRMVRAVALLAADAGDPEEAARAFGVADGVTNGRPAPLVPRAEAAARNVVRCRLGSHAFERAYVGGMLIEPRDYLAMARKHAAPMRTRRRAG